MAILVGPQLQPIIANRSFWELDIVVLNQSLFVQLVNRIQPQYAEEDHATLSSVHERRISASGVRESQRYAAQGSARLNKFFSTTNAIQLRNMGTTAKLLSNACRGKIKLRSFVIKVNYKGKFFRSKTNFRSNFLGRCSCPPGAALRNTTSSRSQAGITFYCSPQCSDNETKIDDTCRPKLKLGEKCGGPLGDCPPKSSCSYQTGRCECPCGYTKIDDYHCGRQPSCELEATLVDANSDFNITDFILCQISGVNTTIKSARKTCPSGQYCADYMEEIGVCCQKSGK